MLDISWSSDFALCLDHCLMDFHVIQCLTKNDHMLHGGQNNCTHAVIDHSLSISDKARKISDCE